MNLPTKLTVLRLLLVPVFMFFLSFGTPLYRWIALALFIIASLTDFLDGYLARKWNQITNLGKLLDPLADKILVAAALIVLVGQGEVPAWTVVIIIARELFVSVFRAVIAADGHVLAAGNWGKAKTVVQMIAIVLILANNFPASSIHLRLDLILYYVSVALTIISGTEYWLVNKDKMSMT